MCNSLFLMQTDEALAKLIESGELVFIKGRDGDDAVLCTSNTTYSVRRAETSNLMMTIGKQPQNLDGYESSPAFQGSTSEDNPE
jgi:hypothetical protein